MELEDIIKSWFNDKKFKKLVWINSDEVTYAHIAIDRDSHSFTADNPISSQDVPMFSVITDEDVYVWSCEYTFTFSAIDSNLFSDLEILAKHVTDCQGDEQACLSLMQGIPQGVPRRH